METRKELQRKKASPGSKFRSFTCSRREEEMEPIALYGLFVDIDRQAVGVIKDPDAG